MNTLIVPLSLLCGVVLCAAASSIFAAWRAHRILFDALNRARERPSSEPADLDPLRAGLEALGAQVRDLQAHPPVVGAAGIPKAGFNLSKRSQALRLHRRGESPAQIAAALDLPRQEVELLLKVHSIVIQNV